MSFYPGKNLGAYGDAGAVLTDDSGLADALRMLRDHGGRKKNFHDLLGTNARMDALQGAVHLQEIYIKYDMDVTVSAALQTFAETRGISIALC